MFTIVHQTLEVHKNKDIQPTGIYTNDKTIAKTVISLNHSFLVI